MPTLTAIIEAMVDINDVLARLDKNTLKMVRKGNEVTKEKIPTSSFGINKILGGGFSIGKQTTVYGNESSGKSMLMMTTVALNQKLGNPCLWIDAEHSFDYEWAERLGVDTNELYVASANSISEVTNIQKNFLEAGIRMIVIDSTSQLHPKSFFDKGGELKNFEDTGQIGQKAKDLGQMSSMVNSINFDAAIVHISQVRMDLSGFMPKPKHTAGKELEHNDSVRIKLTSSNSEKNAIKKNIQYQDIVIEEIVGREVNWTIEKNKVNGRYGKGKYAIFTQGDHVGIDRATELYDIALSLGIITGGGAWVTVGDKRLNGRDKAIDVIREDKELIKYLENEIDGKSIPVSSEPVEESDEL